MTGEQIDEYLQKILPTKIELRKWFKSNGIICKNFEYAVEDLWSYMYNIVAKNLENLKI